MQGDPRYSATDAYKQCLPCPMHASPVYAWGQVHMDCACTGGPHAAAWAALSAPSAACASQQQGKWTRSITPTLCSPHKLHHPRSLLTPHAATPLLLAYTQQHPCTLLTPHAASPLLLANLTRSIILARCLPRTQHHPHFLFTSQAAPPSPLASPNRSIILALCLPLTQHHPRTLLTSHAAPPSLLAHPNCSIALAPGLPHMQHHPCSLLTLGPERNGLLQGQHCLRPMRGWRKWRSGQHHLSFRAARGGEQCVKPQHDCVHLQRHPKDVQGVLVTWGEGQLTKNRLGIEQQLGFTLLRHVHLCLCCVCACVCVHACKLCVCAPSLESKALSHYIPPHVRQSPGCLAM